MHGRRPAAQSRRYSYRGIDHPIHLCHLVRYLHSIKLVPAYTHMHTHSLRTSYSFVPCCFYYTSVFYPYCVKQACGVESSSHSQALWRFAQTGHQISSVCCGVRSCQARILVSMWNDSLNNAMSPEDHTIRQVRSRPRRQSIDSDLTLPELEDIGIAG